MLSLEEAKQLLLDDLGINPNLAKNGDEYAIVEKAIMQKPYGWHLVFNSRKYLETGEIQYLLTGSGGAIVNKFDRGIHYLMPYDIEKQIEEYERSIKSSK